MPAGRALLGTIELAFSLSPYGPEPPSEELLEEMLALPHSDKRVLGGMALNIEKRARERRGIGCPAGDEP